MSQPNVLFLIVDELRQKTSYETPEILQWRKDNLKAQTYLEEKGINFKNHYTAATACCPARTSLFTGQYPSLHGVSQTEGVAKTAIDKTMFWLQPNTVPTMGNWFKEAGYHSIYKGKWHISIDADLQTPGNNSVNAALASYNIDGSVNKINTKYYEKANTLKNYGYGNSKNEKDFAYIGPHPISANPLKSGGSSINEINGRDIIYTEQAIKVLDFLDKSKDDKPFLLVASLVNPHDIALYGELTKTVPVYDFKIDPSVPNIPASSTSNEDLSTKPKAHTYYKDLYQLALQPTLDTETYRKLYYSLNLQVDRQLKKIIKKLKSTRFNDNTIILFVSDHGDLLGSHNGLFQKWMNCYEESIHIPMIIKLPKNIRNSINTNRIINNITSNIDILPTLLGLCNIDQNKILKELKKKFIDARKLVGEDLSSLILNNDNNNNPVLFITDDDPFNGPNMLDYNGNPYANIPQPTSINAIIVNIDNVIWKFARYFDNPRFWSSPFQSNTVKVNITEEQIIDGQVIKINKIVMETYNVPKASEYEMYNLNIDKLEKYNLANPTYSTPESTIILNEQILLKLKMPKLNIDPFDLFPRIVA
jgi:arylsulfatase A-like enzyme